MNTIHQINEIHISVDCTPDQAKEVAANLTRLGWTSEYNSAQGCHSYLLDEDGEMIEIPQDVWDMATANVF